MECKQEHTGPAESRDNLLIGAGKMGRNYLQALLNMGVPQGDISVVDIDTSKLRELKEQFPDIAIGTELPREAPKTAYVISSTPAHLNNLEALAAYGLPPRVLVEKPLITAQQLEVCSDRVQKIINAFSDGVTAYLIDFSPAMTALMSLMQDKNLKVMSGEGTWTKDRRGDKRPTAGDLEDEMTHQVAAHVALAHSSQKVCGASVAARLTYEDFVDPAAQRKLAQQDPSIPLKPNATTHMTLHLHIEGRAEPVELVLYSSFIAAEQKRTISVVLGAGGKVPEYQAIIDFDDPAAKGDVLQVKNLASGDIKRTVFSKPDKLKLQLESFLLAAEYGRRHPFLKNIEQGLSMVALAEAALKSNQNECKFFEVDFAAPASSRKS